MLREPLQQNGLCLGNRGPDGPERVVQIQADGANLAAVAQALKGFNGRGCGVLGLHAPKNSGPANAAERLRLSD
jgi:hypothetical protein